MIVRVPFWKVQSIGNDFPLVHIPAEPLDLGSLAIAMCDRRFGVGGDGLLALERAEPLKLRMFNPDGTEDFCGNGLRCAAVHAHSIGWAGDRFIISHRGRNVQVCLGPTGDVTTVLGNASYDPDVVPLEAGMPAIFDGVIYADPRIEVRGSALTTGSTHVVVPTDALPRDEEFLDLGPKIENFKFYPNRTSVIWSEAVAPDHLRIRIWERGVGETLGCGTGSSAAAIDYLRREGRGGRVTVDNRGGTVVVEASRWDAPITVIGTAAQVFEGEFLWDR
jgi:diaminopimelate epimerase